MREPYSVAALSKDDTIEKAISILGNLHEHFQKCKEPHCALLRKEMEKKLRGEA